MDALYDGIVGAVAIKQCRSGRFSSSMQVDTQRYSGGIDPQGLYVVKAGPRFMWDSHDVAGVLTGISPTTGLATSAGTITLPFAKRAQGGTFSGASANMIVTGANGLTVPHSVSASDMHAAVSLETFFRSTDGLTIPVTASVNTSLTSQAFNLTYALGAVYLTIASGASVLLSQVASVTVNTGLQVVPTTFGGMIYPTQLNIVSRDPAIDVTFHDLDAAVTYGPLFASLDACAVYFRKRVSGGTFVAAGTAEHIKMSFAGSINQVNEISAADQGNGSVTFRMTGLALTTSAASAIP